MDDLISREAAADIVEFECGEWSGLAKTIIDRFESLPTAERRGKWINDGGLYKCSYCKRLWAEWWAISKPIERMRKETPYCPMCGSYNGEEN